MRLISNTLAFLLLAGSTQARADSPPAGRIVAVQGTEKGYVLSRGATSFVIRLKDRAPTGELVFVNENAAAEGKLFIAVSNRPLAADSPHWNAVEGGIRFRKKRLFTVSLVGVEANYLRLTFQVDAPRCAARKTAGDRPRPYKLARIASS